MQINAGPTWFYCDLINVEVDSIKYIQQKVHPCGVTIVTQS